MASTDSLLGYDVGYYEYIPDVWLPGKLIAKDAFGSVPKRAADAAANMPLRDSDVLLAAYPKTGQTWLMTTLYLLRMGKKLEETQDYDISDLYETMPFVEVEESSGRTGVDVAAKVDSPRYLKTHLPYQAWKNNIEKHPNLKIIQTIRNPKDTLVSYYHHNRSDGMLGAFNGTWDQFFDRIKDKKLAWGDYFDVTADWYKFNKDRENSLVVIYEEGKKNPRDRLVKIANFLGYTPSDKLIDIILEKSSIKEAKKKFTAIDAQDKYWNTERSTFVRKGQVGDWANYFSNEQSSYVEERYKQVLEPLGLRVDYEI